MIRHHRYIYDLPTLVNIPEHSGSNLAFPEPVSGVQLEDKTHTKLIHMIHDDTPVLAIIGCRKSGATDSRIVTVAAEWRTYGMLGFEIETPSS